VVDQFDTLDAGSGLHHNGKQVLGEALGDLGGLKIAYKAYRRSLRGKPEPRPIDGFTADQRFFLAFARIWGTEMGEEVKRLQINTQQSPAPAVPGNRYAPEHAGVPPRVRMYRRRRDGPARSAAVQSVVRRIRLPDERHDG